MLLIEHLSKIYDISGKPIKALDDISLQIESGEFVAITGTSGSGKSTLLHIIGGVDTASSGRVTVDGNIITDMNQKELLLYRRTKASIVYQFFNLLPMLNVSENISLARELNDDTCTTDEISNVLNLLDMRDKEFYYPNQLSGGRQQRVAIARALITSPSLLLADEPTGNLDSDNADAIMKLLKKANRERGQTVIMVTHDKRLAANADRIIELHDGKII